MVFSLRPELTGQYQVLLDEPPPLTRDPRLQAEVGQGVPADAWPALAARLARRVRELLVFTPAVELVPYGTLPRAERKAKRLFRTYRGEAP